MVMVQHGARFLLHRYAGPVAHMLVAARKLIKEGGFAAVLISCQSKGIAHAKIALFRYECRMP